MQSPARYPEQFDRVEMVQYCSVHLVLKLCQQLNFSDILAYHVVEIRPSCAIGYAGCSSKVSQDSHCLGQSLSLGLPRSFTGSPGHTGLNFD